MRDCLRIATLVSAGLLFAVPAAAQGQPPRPGPAEAAPAEAKPTEAKMEEARQRYQRGLQLYNELNFEAARVEFERAYQLAPSYKILYNIGLAYEQLGDYVQALTTLQKYLELGGSELTAERRAEVAKELAQIRPRIARVTIKTNIVGAEVLIDDQCGADVTTGNVNCGVIPGLSRELLVNPGRRRLLLRKEGYLPETKIVTIAGSDKIEVAIDLKELPKPFVEKKTNPFMVPMIVGWGVTAGTGIASIVTGVLAKGAESDQTAALEKFPASRQELDDARDKTQTLGTVTDVLLISTGVAAGVSTYFTIRALKWKKESSDVNVQVGMGNIRIGGQF